MIVAWAIAIFASTTILAIAFMMAKRGWFDAREPWYKKGPGWLVVYQIFGLVLLWLLKASQLAQDDKISEPLWCGIVRRLDDISLWTMLMGTAVGVYLAAFSKTISFGGKDNRRSRGLWLLLSTIAIIGYLIAVSWSGGTFFWNHNSATVAKIQIAEGTLVVAHIVTSYVFIATLLMSMIKRQRGSKLIAIALIAGGVVALLTIERMVNHYGQSADWADDCGGFGSGSMYNAWRFWVMVGLVWWPWLLILITIPFSGKPSENEAQ